MADRNGIARPAILTSVLGAAAVLAFGFYRNTKSDCLCANRDTGRTSTRVTFIHRRENVSVSQQPATVHRGDTSAKGSTRMYVVTLDGVPGAHPSNNGRLDKLRSAWTASCPNDPVDFEVCLGGHHPIRGHGVTSAMTQCLERSIQDGIEGALFFEDDARLEETASEFCMQHIRDSFVMSVPNDALIVFIGAHSQVAAEPQRACSLQKTWVTPKKLEFGFRHLKKSFGMYVAPSSYESPFTIKRPF